MLYRFVTDLQKGLISLFVGHRCALSAWLIRWAEGESCPGGRVLVVAMVPVFDCPAVACLGSEGVWVFSITGFMHLFKCSDDDEMYSISGEGCGANDMAGVGEGVRKRFFFPATFSN